MKQWETTNSLKIIFYLHFYDHVCVKAIRYVDCRVSHFFWKSVRRCSPRRIFYSSTNVVKAVWTDEEKWRKPHIANELRCLFVIYLTAKAFKSSSSSSLAIFALTSKPKNYIFAHFISPQFHKQINQRTPLKRKTIGKQIDISLIVDATVDHRPGLGMNDACPHTIVCMSSQWK